MNRKGTVQGDPCPDKAPAGGWISPEGRRLLGSGCSPTTRLGTQQMISPYAWFVKVPPGKILAGYGHIWKEIIDARVNVKDLPSKDVASKEKFYLAMKKKCTEKKGKARTKEMRECNAFCINSDEGAIFFKSNQPIWEDAPKVNPEGSAIKGSYTCYGVVNRELPITYQNNDNVDPYCGLSMSCINAYARKFNAPAKFRADLE